MTQALWSRRGVLKAAAALAAAPAFVPASALGRGGRPAPSGRVAMALLGCGSMGVGGALTMRAHPACEYIAGCDPDRQRRESFAARLAADERPFRGAATANDFRDILVRDDIDAVYIASPDHWHAAMAIAALDAGKHVYCEKPLALAIGEGIAIRAAARRSGRVFQHGTQARSNAQVRQAVELVRNGRIGKVRKVELGFAKGVDSPPVAEQPIPEGFDYDLWLGPAPWAPYAEERCHHYFRYNLDYSGGSITDLGSHYLDAAMWGCGKEDTGPVEIEGIGDFPRDGLYNTAVDYEFRSRFDDGLVFEGSTRRPWGWGVHWIGDEGWIRLTMAHPLPPIPTEASDPAILAAGILPHEWRTRPSRNHWTEFVDSVLAGSEPVVGVEAAHRTTTVAHLANLAMQLRRPLRWDPAAERFPGDAEANRRLTKPYRGDWTL